MSIGPGCLPLGFDAGDQCRSRLATACRNRQDTSPLRLQERIHGRTLMGVLACSPLQVDWHF